MEIQMTKNFVNFVGCSIMMFNSGVIFAINMERLVPTSNYDASWFKVAMVIMIFCLFWGLHGAV
tara:strand:+ start:3260 stop:3451 length:192 start_codon:yes stop_codon:yes gene_type:complete